MSAAHCFARAPAAHVKLYVVIDDAHLNGVIQTGVTACDVEFYGLTNETLDLRHEDFFRFLRSDHVSGRA